MFYEFRTPVPVVTPMGNGYILYVRDGGMWENDIFAVVQEDGGYIKHFTSEQIKVWQNATFDIKQSK